MKKTKTDDENLVSLVDKLLSVPRSEIKAKLATEKKAKKRKKLRKSSASRVAGAKD